MAHAGDEARLRRGGMVCRRAVPNPRAGQRGGLRRGGAAAGRGLLPPLPRPAAGERGGRGFGQVYAPGVPVRRGLLRRADLRHGHHQLFGRAGAHPDDFHPGLGGGRLLRGPDAAGQILPGV